MFSRQDVIVTLGTLKVRVEDNKEQTRKMVDVKCRLAPLDVELAQDIDSSLVYHCFMKDGGDFKPRPEVPSKGWSFDRLKIKRQNIIFRAAEDVEAARQVSAVDVKSLTALVGKDDPHVTLSFDMTFEIPEPQVHKWLSEMVGEPVAVTFEEMQPTLPIVEAHEEEQYEATTH